MFRLLIILSLLLIIFSCKKDQPILPNPVEIIYYELIDTTIESTLDSSSMNLIITNLDISLVYKSHKYFNPALPEADTNGYVDGGYSWYIKMNNEDDFAATYCYFSSLSTNKDDVIDSNYYEFKKSISLDYINSIGPGGSCSLQNNTNFYMGFRKKVENGYNYGWIKFYRTDFHFTLVDMALNLALNKPIIIGQKE